MIYLQYNEVKTLQDKLFFDRARLCNCAKRMKTLAQSEDKIDIKVSLRAYIENIIKGGVP